MRTAHSTPCVVGGEHRAQLTTRGAGTAEPAAAYFRAVRLLSSRRAVSSESSTAQPPGAAQRGGAP
eukprot:scaffold3779_cov55-Phaeocystis_antarctica.AAC.3